MRYGVRCPSFSSGARFMITGCAGVLRVFAPHGVFELNDAAFCGRFANFTPVAHLRHPFGEAYF